MENFDLKTMTPPMIPTAPECGAPCAEFEALAHTVAKLRAELATYRDPEEYPTRLELVINENAQLRAELESVRSGSAKVCRELRESLRICDVLATDRLSALLKADKRAEKAEAEIAALQADVNNLNNLLRAVGWGQGEIDSAACIEEENENLRAKEVALRAIETAARDLIEYQNTGGPVFAEWDAKFDALEAALAQGGAK